MRIECVERQAYDPCSVALGSLTNTLTLRSVVHCHGSIHTEVPIQGLALSTED